MKMSEEMGGFMCSGLDVFEIAVTKLNSGIKKTMNLKSRYKLEFGQITAWRCYS